jgi:hypothetical protein
MLLVGGLVPTGGTGLNRESPTMRMNLTSYANLLDYELGRKATGKPCGEIPVQGMQPGVACLGETILTG